MQDFDRDLKPSKEDEQVNSWVKAIAIGMVLLSAALVILDLQDKIGRWG